MTPVVGPVLEPEESTTTVRVWMIDASAPIVHEDVTNTYIKGFFFCIYQRSRHRVLKYPERNIWRVEDEYPDSTRRNL